MNYRTGNLRSLPDVVKNLLIINGLFFLATITLDNMDPLFGLHQFQSPEFMPHQLITHLFMHGNFTHLLFNMFALWMFGRVLENAWGGKRFLTYYIITGFGAALIYVGYIQFQIHDISSNMSLLQMESIKQNKILTTPTPEMRDLHKLIHSPMVGASGAVYGLLLAFGMLFPNSLIYLYFAIPVKAKYFVGGIGLLALISGIGNNPGDNVAHFAHLGGMIFGFLLIKYWKRNSNTFF